MNFEEAARQHKRLEKVEGVLRLRDDLAVDLAKCCGAAVTASTEPGAVNLWFCHLGWWQPPAVFRTAETEEGASVSLDQRLRELVAAMEWKTYSARRRQEHLAILARWYYSSWRDGEWLAFERPEDIPYRKLVRAISRVAG
jgi:excinuclease ABC subunit C